MNGVDEAVMVLYEADAVCFDMDSTVIKAAAMPWKGGIKFQNALSQPLGFAPTVEKSQILDFWKYILWSSHRVSNNLKLISTLHAKGGETLEY